MAVQTQIQTRRGTAATWTSTNPTLAAGEIGFETDTNKFKIGTGSTAWTALSYAGGATAVTYLFNATSGQTTFSGADANSLTLAYTVGAEQVYLNGALQVRGSDYTATNGTSIVLASGAITSDVLNVIAYSAMTITDTYTQAQANAAFIAKTLTTTKGDIITATAASTPARLPVGSDTQILVADSTAATGLKWATAAGGGKVLQVVYAATTTSTNIASTSLTSTTLSASITPSLSSSKVLIIANNNFYNDTAGRGAAAAITRGATTLIHQNDTNNAGTFNLSDSRGSATIPIQYLDSPSTTSSITYTIKATSIGGANVTFQNGGSPSNILLFEIGA